MTYKLLFILSLSLLISCNKKNSVPPLEETWPQKWILTVDESADKYTYLEVNGNNMKRSQILKSYSLVLLAEEKNCNFLVSLSKSEAGKSCYTMQIEKTPTRWMFAGPSTNQQEVHLGMSGVTGSSTTSPGNSDNYKFFIHFMPRVNDVRTVTIESVEKPGYYISTASPGFNYSPTQAVLTQHSKPEEATHWQCR
ncbi:MAG: hypothetical protein ABIR18_03310 [Chitinophagaceae bacterium]